MWLHLVAKFINNASGAMGPLWLCSGMVDYGEWLCRKSKVIFQKSFFSPRGYFQRAWILILIRHWSCGPPPLIKIVFTSGVKCWVFLRILLKADL